MDTATATKPDARSAARLDYDTIIIGAGLSGMYQLYRLRNQGQKVRVFEMGTGVGGTWYWNRYPGARFDSESYSYGYSWSQEVLDEWDWTEHFAPQPETERYCNFVADKFDLRKDIQFSARVKAAHYQEGSRSWKITLDDDSVHTSRWLVTAVGPLSAPVFPRVPGRDTYKGEAYHTGLWPKHDVTFAGKRVAVIGTGATGVQAITEIAKTAKHLTVFQRRPNWCKPLRNKPISKAEMEDIKQQYDEIFRKCQESATCFLHSPDKRNTFDVSPEEREAFWEHQYNEPGFSMWVGGFKDMMTNSAANQAVSEFVAAKIRQRVNDPEVAELLIPDDHGFGTRRVPQESGYYEVYNQDNVDLVSILKTPIEEITEKGLRTSERDYEFDMIVYATGFDAITGSLDRIDIRGENEQKLKDKWNGGPKTFVGVMVVGFPNMFMLVGPHTALGNIPRSIEYNVEWVDDLIGYLETNGYTYANPTQAAEDHWTETVVKSNEGLLSAEVDSWMTGVNQNVEGKQQRIIARYSGTAPAYREYCDQVSANSYTGIETD